MYFALLLFKADKLGGCTIITFLLLWHEAHWEIPLSTSFKSKSWSYKISISQLFLNWLTEGTIHPFDNCSPYMLGSSLTKVLPILSMLWLLLYPLSCLCACKCCLFSSYYESLATNEPYSHLSSCDSDPIHSNLLKGFASSTISFLWVLILFY